MMPARMIVRCGVALCALFLLALQSGAAEDQKPRGPIGGGADLLRALLIIGGCCHDYETQKDILKQGLESRLTIRVDIVFSPDTTTTPALAIYGNPNYAEGYDVVIHDECAADINTPELVSAVLAPHQLGTPGVNLHCAVHSYRTAPDVNVPAQPGSPESLWFDYLGLQSSGHGPQLPIAVAYAQPAPPLARGLADWTTINEELYNNIVVREGVQVIARGSQQPNDRPNHTEAAVVWTHEFGRNKTRVFSTSLGHNNETVADARYLDLVARGLLWACGKLDDAGEPAPGFWKTSATPATPHAE